LTDRPELRIMTEMAVLCRKSRNSAD